MAPHAEAAGQVQSLHGLRLHLTKNRLTHSLKLVVELIIDLQRAVGDGWGGIHSIHSLPQCGDRSVAPAQCQVPAGTGTLPGQW